MTALCFESQIASGHPSQLLKLRFWQGIVYGRSTYFSPKRCSIMCINKHDDFVFLTTNSPTKIRKSLLENNSYNFGKLRLARRSQLHNFMIKTLIQTRSV